MCGIVGVVARRNVVPVMLEGLKRLEYRGYDSCGIALFTNGHLERSRSTSRVAELEKQVDHQNLSGFLGIAHTRWATHVQDHAGIAAVCRQNMALLRRIMPIPIFHANGLHWFITGLLKIMQSCAKNSLHKVMFFQARPTRK